MTIRVSWDSEDRTTLHFDFPAAWTWSMFGEAMKTCAHEARGNRQVNLIFDLTHSTGVPEGAPFHIRASLITLSLPMAYLVVAATSPAIHNAFALMAEMDETLADALIPVRSVDAARAVLSHPYSLRTPVSPANIERG